MNRRNHVEEVVDDSEPEREEIRKKEILERRSKRKRILEIIELTDTEHGSEEQSKVTPPPNHISGSTLDISDDDTHASGAQASPVAMSAISVPPVATLSVSKDSESEEDELGMDIARFAYKSVSRSSTAPHLEDGSSRPITFVSITDTGNPTLNKKSIRRQRSIVDIPDMTVAKLMICVSCNLKWTARKTVREKMKHIQLCAKRNLLTDETVGVLIRQEIDKLPITDKGKEKGQYKLPKEPNTVLEDVLNDHAPKKRRKRPEVLKTVKSLAETRNVILDRARTILGDAGDVDFTIQTQEFGPSKLIDSLPKTEVVGLFPLTQPPGKSTLGLGQGQTITRPMTSANNRTGGVPGSEHCNDIDIDAVPPTQEFAPSKVGGSRVYVRATSGPDLDGTNDSVPNSPVTPAALTKPSVVEYFTPPVTSFIDSANPHARERSPHRRLRVSREESQSLLHDHSIYAPDLIPENLACSEDPGTSVAICDGFSWDDDNDDDAYLHFDPSAEIHNPRQPTMLQNDLIPSDTHLIYVSPSATHTTPRRREYPEEQVTNETISKKKATGKGRHRKGDYDEPYEIPDDSWESRMKDMIIEDNILYQRILRYEPIHFDVFFQLAVEQGPSLPPPGLRVKLRSLLDKLTINFYGADPAGRRY